MQQSGYAFGDFELHPGRFELRRRGRLVRLERRPMELLILLAGREGDLVARAEIAERLWGKDVFVDTEHGINTAVRKIRRALGEDAERPHFLITVPGKGYRLAVDPSHAGIAIVTPEPAEPPLPEIARTAEAAAPPRVLFVPRWIRFATIVVALGTTAIAVNWFRGPVGARSPDAPIRSLAVLPFVNLTGDAASEYLADGITDELITTLAQHVPLRVVSRTTVMQFKGAHRPLPEIGRELGVDVVVEGSLSRVAGHFHLSIQLVRTANDVHVWAGSYDRDLDALYELPGEVSELMARRIGLPSARAGVPRLISPAAHDAYLQGRYFWFSQGWDRAVESMQRAVALQPDYAAAWSGLADAYIVKAVAGLVPPNTVAALAEAAVRRALELDDTLAEAHNTAAALALFHTWDFQLADRESRRAVELNPNFAEAHHLRGYVLVALNRLDEALQEQTRASELDPFERPFGIGFILIHQRQYDAAVRELSFRQEARPSDRGVRSLLADAYLYSGRASDYVTEIKSLAPDDSGRAAIEAGFARGGLRGVADVRLDRILHAAAEGYVSPLSLAHAYARDGRRDATLSQLEAAVAERAPFVVFVRTDPDFDLVRDDVRYRTLVGQLFARGR
jgi:TolB-like protein/DNA-binding winged helix-turn-helix (wHTH) protein